jgi:hypothetical protein
MTKPEKPNGKNADENYAVGYGKPPAHTRFKKGQSGNPKGRPKGVRNFATDVRETLKAPVRVTRNGRPKSVSTQEAMLLRLREQALSGNARSLDRYLQLAQKYNSEELTAEAGVSDGDAQLLEVYKARLQRGAIAANGGAVPQEDEGQTNARSNEGDQQQQAEGESIKPPAGVPAPDVDDKS